MQKQIREEFPDTTLWQRYAHDEYAQLAYEEELREQHGGGEGFDDDFDGSDGHLHQEMHSDDVDSDGSYDDRQDDENFLFDADISNGQMSQQDEFEWAQ